MPSGFLLASLVLALAGAAALLMFESPIRAAGGLITTFVGVAACAGSLSAPLVPGFVLWVGVGGVGLLLLGAVLVLAASHDERTPRRYGLRPALGLVATALLFAALALSVPTALTARAPLDTHAVANALSTELAPALGTALVALAAAVLVTLGLVRRRS